MQSDGDVVALDTEKVKEIVQYFQFRFFDILKGCEETEKGATANRMLYPFWKCCLKKHLKMAFRKICWMTYFEHLKGVL